MDQKKDPVRPTLRLVRELEISLPSVDVGLHNLRHPIVEKSQDIPSQVDSGGAKRIRDIKDRVWFKVKVNDDRGGVVKIEPKLQEKFQGLAWWLGLYGKRVDDSGRHDFYENLPSNSDDFLPNCDDNKRLELEIAYRFRQDVKFVARQATCLSLTSGKVAQISLGDHGISIRCRVRMMSDGDTYISVGYARAADPKFIAFVLDAFPGVNSNDWQVEPSEVVEIEPMEGEIVYSAIFPTKVQASLLAEFDSQET